VQFHRLLNEWYLVLGESLQELLVIFCVFLGTSAMGLLGMMGDSFGCSATGERLVSAARDGDIQEARALLELNPRLARYSTFGIRNSPLHYSAAKGHHEVNHWFCAQSFPDLSAIILVPPCLLNLFNQWSVCGFCIIWQIVSPCLMIDCIPPNRIRG
jgi:hypothetical protein